jgi:hypothetical protein
MRRRHFGIVFQFFNLLEGMTVLENVVLPAMIAGTKRKPAETRRISSTCSASVTRRATFPRCSPVGSGSGSPSPGRRNKPTLLLADEPTGAPDTDGGREVLELFKRLHADGQTILMVTHNDEVASAADRIVRMRRAWRVRASPKRSARAPIVGLGRDRSVDGVTMSRTVGAIETIGHPGRTEPTDPIGAAVAVRRFRVRRRGAAAGPRSPHRRRWRAECRSPCRATGATRVWAIAGILIGFRRRSEPFRRDRPRGRTSAAVLAGSASADSTGGRGVTSVPRCCSRCSSIWR